MLGKATIEFAARVYMINNLNDICTTLDAKSLTLAPFCGDLDCEKVVRNESTQSVILGPGAPSVGAKSLCIPFACDFFFALHCGLPPTCTECFNQPLCTPQPLAYALFG
ncbi:hypothetical protein EG68_12531 [Paragonimus skrjabini miyazakii]|uniref:Proline-tRNA ligase class II C-terminal domain-containing protein n=1 Tax=Paragonimus skrjabini miyazakii TaxID=59628 RepID=A0A8S9YJR1_9TREM|nr:hypothetical protein EG68_12531 [Paragonimus skrjabini miyazakii]